jgi:hypothetical protein
MTRAVRLSALVGVGAVYSWWLASTTPFTWTADGVVAVGFGLMAVVAGNKLVRPRPRAADPDTRSTGSAGRAGADGGPSPPTRAWVLALAFVVAVELFTYVAGWSGNRHDFPTISSLYDTAAGYRAAKAAIVFAWVALGWALFHRQRRVRRRPGEGRP